MQKRFLCQAAWCDDLLLSFIGRREKDVMRGQGLEKHLAGCFRPTARKAVPEAGQQW